MLAKLYCQSRNTAKSLEGVLGDILETITVQIVRRGKITSVYCMYRFNVYIELCSEVQKEMAVKEY